MSKLKFGKGNAKLSKDIYTFSLPAGHSCPFANECKSSADRVTGKITDGPNQVYRCFAASAEALYTSTRKSRWANYDLLKDCKTKKQMVDLIEASLPKKFQKIRIHVSGDFFNQMYFDAWLEITKRYPDKIFYAYTKSIPYWVKRKDEIPDNFKLTGSMGGKNDLLIRNNNLKNAVVVFSEIEANSLKREIDHDDSHAYDKEENFALLIHGTQKSGTFASLALTNLRKKGVKGYSKKK